MSLLTPTDALLIPTPVANRRVRSEMYYTADKLSFEYQALSRCLKSLVYCLDIDARLGIIHDRDTTDFCLGESPTLLARLKALLSSPMGHHADIALQQDGFMLVNQTSKDPDGGYRLYLTSTHYVSID